MAVATLSTAWSAYQSTVWGSIQEFDLHTASVQNDEINSLRGTAMQFKMVDVSLFTNWANAEGANIPNLSKFYYDRFPPRMRTAFDAWMALDPLNDTTAPKHFFGMKEYVVPQEVSADSVQVIYKASVIKARTANSNAEHYMLLTVIFASVLFFGGISSNMKSPGTRKAIVIGGALMLGVAVTWMLTFPMILR